MTSKALGTGAGAACVLAIATVFLAPACGGDDAEGVDALGAAPDGSTGSDAAPTSEASTTDVAPSAPDCTVNEDCAKKLPATTPADCAVATCDTLQKKCHFRAKDGDGDGHPAKNCTAPTATIETGDDCDDGDPNTFPGAWDGPATDFDAGTGAQADRCDQRDNDCNGSPDDGKVKVDGGDKTCTCDPNKPLPCYEYPNGAPIDAATLGSDNSPKGMCKKGTRTCVAGIPSACTGAIGPDPVEQCDTIDHDCDGLSGTAGDTAPAAPVWYKDNDNDNFGDMRTTPKQQCAAPPGPWRTNLPNTDCNDDDGASYPGRAEDCDGKDNNCNGSIDEGVKPTWYKDKDNDGFGDVTTAPAQQCSSPAGLWKVSIPNTDCNDDDGAAYPGRPEVCDGKDNDCDGSIDEDVKTHFCADADNDTSCTATCVDACAPPASYRLASTCSVGTDCNDTPGAGASVRPGAADLCGDGIDSNCTGGDNDLYPNLGAACVGGEGSFGVCKRAGNYVCTAARTATVCSVTAGTPVVNGDTVASADPAIDLSQTRTGYNPRWDWNCDNAQTIVEPSGSNALRGDPFRSSACIKDDAHFETACRNFANEAACTGFKFFSCATTFVGGTTYIAPTDVAMCGRTYSSVLCLWDAGICHYLATSYSAVNGTVKCK